MLLRTGMTLLWVAAAATVSGCVTVNFPDISSAPGPGTPFTVSGVAVDTGQDAPCLEWIGDNGITYHLFQAPDLDNDIFDEITTPGVRSRLVLATREDIPVACGSGISVEVRDVLEIAN